MTVPFLDLWRVHAPLAAELSSDFASLIERGSFVNGAEVGAFEEAFAEYCGTMHCVGVSNGLDGLRLALLASGLERGGEVIVPANTFIATVEAVTQAGLVPVLVDASEADYNLDLSLVGAALTDRTSAVVPVHLYGQMTDMHAVAGLARERDLVVVEDAAQAHGARRDGLRSGEVSTAAAFSFYPGKNLGAMGDAGAVITEDAELAARLRALREHGQREKYRHVLEGYTARLDTLQAIVLLRKLPHLDVWNEQRRAVASAYTRELSGVGDLVLPPTADRSEPVWHLYVVRTEDPAVLAAHLASHGIGTGRHYPEPVHLSEAYRNLGYARGDFPVAERLASTVLSLPIFPGMTTREIEAVVRAVGEYFDG